MIPTTLRFDVFGTISRRRSSEAHTTKSLSTQQTDALMVAVTQAILAKLP